MPQQASFRAERVNELIKRELVLSLSTGTKDPRLKADGVIKEPLEALVSDHEGLADLNKIINN